SLTSLYVQTISDAAARARSEASHELSGLREHAERARDRMMPAVQSAIEALKQDPVAAGKESLRAGLAATQHAAGGLFVTMGRLPQQAGQRMRSSDHPGE